MFLTVLALINLINFNSSVAYVQPVQGTLQVKAVSNSSHKLDVQSVQGGEDNTVYTLQPASSSNFLN